MREMLIAFANPAEGNIANASRGKKPALKKDPNGDLTT